MNVLYDISTLGRMHGEAIPKTGIARVIEELVFALAARPECHLELCANEYLLGSVDYAEIEPLLKTLPFPHSPSGVALQRRQSRAQLAVDASSGPSRFVARLARKLLDYTEKTNKNLAHKIDPESLNRADIYHSTYLALPEQLKGRKRPQAFLTVYDLIPVLFPQYGNVYLNTLFDQILASISEDTWILSISEATKADLCSYLKLDPRRVFVTPLAADATLFYPNGTPEEDARIRRKYGIPAGPYVLSLCTIAPHKNIDHVIRSFVKLRQEQPLPDLSLVLAGAKGWNYDHIFQEIAGAEALKDSIVVTGFVANEDLAGLYSGALAFVFPSLYEGFGLPPLEAMQCGTPVITSNTSSLPEVVGEAGIMLDPKDVDGLCQSLLSLYRDAGLRAQMSAASLVRAKEFSWKRCAEETVQAYQASLA